MAALESSGFTHWVQHAHLRFVFVPYPVPSPVAHPPPSFCPAESAYPSWSVLDSIGDVCPDSPY